MRMFTTVDYNEAKKYATNLIFKTKYFSLKPHDLVNESFENNVFVYGKMREFLFSEKRRNKVSLPDIVLCTKCNKVKANCEFYYRTDYRTNMTYNCQPCKECFQLKYQANKLNRLNSKR